MPFLDVYPKFLSNENMVLPDEALINQIFEATYAGVNSSYVDPSAISKEESYKLWRKYFEERIRTGSTYILLFSENALKGYLSYKIRYDKQDIFIGDLIIVPQHQGDGHTISRLMCGFFNEIKEIGIDNIRTHTHMLNKRMQGILAKAGFTMERHTNKGIDYITTKAQLLNKYSRILLLFCNNQ